MTDRTDFDSYVKDAESLRAISEAADLPTERARNNCPTLTFRGARLHSQMDPVAEADVLLENSRAELETLLKSGTDQTVTCFVCGAGLGYVVGALSTIATALSACHRLRVVCLETDAEIARKALQLRVWEPCDLDVSWIVGAQNIEALSLFRNLVHTHVFAGTAGYRMNKAAYADLLHALGGRSAAERPMRILVPTPLYGGSLPIAFHCAEAFRKLGHSVDVLDLSPYYPLYSAVEKITTDPHHRKSLQGLFATYLAELIAARAMDWNADLVWAVAQTPLTPSALEEMSHEGIHSAFWFVEDYTVFNYWRELAPHFDAVFTIQRGHFHDELESIGVKHASYLPCAANPEIHHPRNLTEGERERFGSDVSFVGAGYGNRQTLFAQLALKNFKIWGADWPADSGAFRYVQEGSRRVSTEETAAIYSATKVNLNLHSSPHHAGINPNGDYVNPRTLEIAACGAFQLVDARSELAALLNPGEEIVVFERADEIPGLIEYYLEHPDERQLIADRARQRVVKEHTYERRLAGALEFLEARFRRLSERKRGPNYVSSLKQAAGDDQELLDFLSAYPDDQEVDLDKIVARIELGKGELTRAEGIFLLMKEFRDWGREKGVIQ